MSYPQKNYNNAHRFNTYDNAHRFNTYNNAHRFTYDNLHRFKVWTRTMVEIESMATQGGISRPGAWSFPDCLELGVAGEGTFTWNEAQTVLALFAVTSSPLILGYVRTCHVCESSYVYES